MTTTAAAVPDATPSATPKAARKADYGLLTFYRENYFIFGFTEQTQVKFQFSAKYDLWPNEGQNAVYFAFTQLSLWDLYDQSSPFRETNYAPELFYIYFHHPGRYDPPPGCAFFHERGGYEHVSNGVAGPRSRGWNNFYAESRFACYGAAHDFGLATLKAWFPFDKGDNPDIADFIGYGELQLTYGDEGGGTMVRRLWDHASPAQGDGDLLGGQPRARRQVSPAGVPLLEVYAVSLCTVFLRLWGDAAHV